MGVVFTSLFAFGLVLIVQAADQVDLDPGCVLYGAIEMTPLDTVSIAGWDVPRAAVVLGVVAIINAIFVTAFFKELKISSFDAALATSAGFNARLMHYLLMTLVAITAVASFESVGNILVVAMFVVPPAAAYMLTDRLVTMVWCSLVLAIVAAVTGHLSALIVPAWFGFRSTTTAGMMATMAGVLFLFAAALGPRHGVLVRFARHRVLAWRILADDVVAWLYRVEERGDTAATTEPALQEILLCDRFSLKVVIRRLRWRDEIRLQDGAYQLTSHGRARAQNLVRSHRLWEEYLSSHAGVDPERIHDKAERFEHFTDPRLRERLDQETDTPRVDPHGSPIPAEDPTQ